MKFYLLHPIAVHFPIVLLTIGFFIQSGRRLFGHQAWLVPAASWLLWLGTLAAWAAVGLGVLAQRTAPHIPNAWEELADHRLLGFWTAGVFSVLSIWRKFAGEKFQPWFTLVWAGAVALLMATASHGGDLVYEFGMGVGGG